VAHLRKLSGGEMVSYETLQDISGWRLSDPRNREPLHKARKILMREDRIRFACRTGQGVVRMTDKDVAEDSIPAMGRMHRKALNEQKKVTAIQAPEKLSNSELDRTLRISAHLGAVAAGSTPKAVEKLIDKTTNAHGLISGEELRRLAIKQLSAG
jgi:hypothetical protein